MKHLTIYNLSDSIACCEAEGLSKVFKAYADNCAGEPIFEIGFNANSGYIYIALKCMNITIASCLGQEVVYIMTNFDTGSEEFFDSYEEAANFQF
jgi:hypothetical protein